MKIFAIVKDTMKMFRLILFLLCSGTSAQALEPELKFDRVFDLGRKQLRNPASVYE